MFHKSVWKGFFFSGRTRKQRLFEFQTEKAINIFKWSECVFYECFVISTDVVSFLLIQAE